MCAQAPRRVRLFATPWTVAHQAPLSMEFSRQDYWSELPFPTLRDLPDPGIKTVSVADSLPLAPLGKPFYPVQFSSVQSLSRVPLFATP